VEEEQPDNSSLRGKYKIQHEEVAVEDDLDIPAFLRNK